MIAHIVLFEPKKDLGAEERAHLLESLSAAAKQIPSIRRFTVGRRIRHGLPGYEQAMTQSFEYAAVAEFDDMQGLTDYLQHPAHHAIGRHFSASAERALAYDYEIVTAGEAASLLG